ncbi:hypothetical protein E0W72_04875 [Flavobacterium arcticum]|nr:DUF6311 domain-containing protein [Flavobacterium arcticum]KAF2511640.1 hypothetical protein E0W72_04875 [Flavobacterium arcticum]
MHKNLEALFVDKKWITEGLTFVLIILIFNYTYGLEIIAPSNINWLLSIRHDWGQHYLGWAFYRNEPWTFPLGEMQSVIYPTGTNVGYWDTAPGVAIFFKLLNPILPDTFQYLGGWLLLCHLLTGYFTIKILRLYNIKWFYIVFFAVLIGFNPVLVYRMMHPALCSHFFILASLYLYLKPANAQNVDRINKQQLLLIVLSAAINPYICFMVSGFNFLVPFKHCRYDKLISVKRFLAYLSISALSVVLVWYSIGMISFGGDTSLGVSKGYGLYGFNLNSLTNSFGFSTIFPKQALVTDHQYEGFMYLGLGFMLLIGIASILFIIIGKPIRFIKKNKFILPLFILCLFVTVFAITHIVTYNDTVLFEYYTPKIIRIIGGVFRATGRFMWIPYYIVILFFIIIFLRTKLPDWFKSVFILIIVGAQAYDLQNLYTPRNFPYGDYDSPLIEERWNAIIPVFDAMITYPSFDNHLLNAMDYQDLCFMALKNHKPISTGYSARENYKGNKKYTESLTASLKAGNFSSGELYITTSKHLDAFSTLLQNNKVTVEYIDGYYILYDKEKVNKIKFKREASVFYKTDLKDVSSNTKFVRVQDIDTIHNSRLKFKLNRLITNQSSITLEGSTFIENEIKNKNDSVFVTISDGSQIFITQTKQNTDTSDKERLSFSSFILVNNFLQDNLILGIAIKKHSGIWVHNSIGKLSEIKKTIKSIKKDKLPSQKAQIGVIDYLTEEDDTLEFYGWTAFKDIDATDSEVEVVFMDNDNIYVYPSTVVNRFDVTEAYKREYDYNNSGFRALINKKDIPQGNYKIGLLVRNKSTNDESLMMTDKTFIKQ